MASEDGWEFAAEKDRKRLRGERDRLREQLRLERAAVDAANRLLGMMAKDVPIQESLVGEAHDAFRVALASRKAPEAGDGS